MKDRAEQRIEVGLGQLVVESLTDQLDIVPLGLTPALAVGQDVLVKGALQAPQGLVDLFLIEVDPLRRGLLGLAPLRCPPSPQPTVLQPSACMT